MAEDGDGDHWFATHAGISRLHDGRFITYTQQSGLPVNLAHCVYADFTGRIWVGTRGGASRFNGVRFITMTPADGLVGKERPGDLSRSGRRVFLVWNDRVGSAIGTAFSFKNYKPSDGLPAASIAAIEDDPDGTLWLAGPNSGLIRFKNDKFAVATAKRRSH